MKLIIGLGNPGKDYAGTRHNVGARAVELLAEKLELTWKLDKKRQTEVASTIIDDVTVVLAKPAVFMNESGETAQALMHFYKINLDDLLVIHDEMDFPAGKIAFLTQGGPAGHKGIANIQARLNSEAFNRLRVGIDRPAPPIKTEDWALGRPAGEDKEKINDAVRVAGDAVLDWIADGIAKTASTWNRG
jgi:PTH1 family peptidyl-tRNA hydrolase